MVSTVVIFIIAPVAFVIALAVVVFRLVWVRRTATESYLRTYAPQPPRERE